MTDAHNPRVLSDADAAADLAGVPRPNRGAQKYASEASTKELLLASKQADALHLADALEKDMQYPLHGKAADTIRTLVSERDALAVRVRELEGDRDAALVDSERRHTLLKMQHAESVELYNALSDLSFECDGVTCVLPPSRETYNRTFMVLKMKPHLSPAALRGYGESGAAIDAAIDAALNASKEQP